MPNSYIIFKRPFIMHGTLDEYSAEDIEGDKKKTLQDNGVYLDQGVFGTDFPESIANQKLFYSEKIPTEEEGHEFNIYIVNLKGLNVAMCDHHFEAEEYFCLPDHLFEI